MAFVKTTPVASPVDTTLCFLGFWTSTKIKMCVYKEIGVFMHVFEILANVDLNLRLKLQTCNLVSYKIFVSSHRYQKACIEKLV